MAAGEFFGVIGKLLQIGAAKAGTDYAGDNARLYDLVEQYTTDVTWYIEQAKALGRPVLELGCGTGRVLIPLARAGVGVTGVDLSADMLALCRDKLDALGPSVARRATLVTGDMRHVRLGRTFGLVLLPLYTFVHALTAEDKRATFTTVAEHLEPGGVLLMEAELQSGWRESPEPVLNVVRRDRATGDLLLVLHQSRLQPDGSVLLNLLNIVIQGGDGSASLSAIASNESRTTLEELAELVRGSGLELDGFYGDYDWGPLSDGARGVVVRATKPL